MKRQISLILVLLFALAALPLGVLAAGNDYRYATEHVNMRTGPGTQYDVIRELQTGEQVEYLKRSGKWAKVKRLCFRKVSHARKTHRRGHRAYGQKCRKRAQRSKHSISKAR